MKNIIERDISNLRGQGCHNDFGIKRKYQGIKKESFRH